MSKQSVIHGRAHPQVAHQGKRRNDACHGQQPLRESFRQLGRRRLGPEEFEHAQAQFVDAATIRSQDSGGINRVEPTGFVRKTAKLFAWRSESE